MGVSPFGSFDLVEPGFETTRAHIDGSLRPPPPFSCAQPPPARAECIAPRAQVCGWARSLGMLSAESEPPLLTHAARGPCHGKDPGHRVAQMKAAFIGSAGMKARPGLFDCRECLVSLPLIS